MNIRLVILACTVLSLVACASPVPQHATRLKPEKSCRGLYIAQEASVELPTGYRCKIKAGTRWVLVGEVDQGEVYKPLDQVVNVVGRHADEAYLVVSSGSIVGFYLPARSTFAPAAHPLDLVAAQPLTPSQGAPCAK